MEWEEIYGTNPSRVLKTLASAAATSSSFSPSLCSPLLLHPLSNQNPDRGSPASQSSASPKAERHIIFGQSAQLQLLVRDNENMDTSDTLWQLLAESCSRTLILNDHLYKHQKLIYDLIDLLAVIYNLV